MLDIVGYLYDILYVNKKGYVGFEDMFYFVLGFSFRLWLSICFYWEKLEFVKINMK